MDESKLVKLIGDIALAAACIYALDGVGKFLADYNATKDRVEVLEMTDAARAVFHTPTADETKKARAAGAGLGDARRLRPVKTKDEPHDAVPEQEM